MKQEKFYSNRLLTVLLSILQFGVAYLAYTNVLADPYGLTDFGYVAIYVIVIIMLFMGSVFLIMTCDPRPIIQISSEGIKVRTFIFWEEFVPWNQVLSLQKETHTKRMINMAGYVKVSSRFLRIDRPEKRSLAVNLTLLNKRGDTFYQTISKYIDVA